MNEKQTANLVSLPILRMAR